jgi:AmmeMemoRadiSam system protein B
MRIDTLLAIALKISWIKIHISNCGWGSGKYEMEGIIMDLRPAIFAGSWYPQKAGACEGEIKQFLAGGVPKPQTQQTWMGGIVPHAGWYYSGQIACNVIHWLKDETPVDLVVLFGMHLHSGSANYLMARGAWQTPLGALPVDEELADHLMQRFDFQQETASRFTQDNTIEVQLPFVKYLLEPKQILRSLDIGRAVVDWSTQKGLRLKIIGSTDLTHYGRNYGFSPQGSGPEAVDWVRHENDRRMVEAILAMDPHKVMAEAIRNQNACCSGAVAVAVAAVQHMGATVSKEVAYASSYDKSPGDSFVGYVGAAFA